MKKRIFSLLLILILTFSICPFSFADYDDGVYTLMSEYYMTGGEGVGFHDNKDVEDDMEKQPEYWGHGGLILRYGEWVKYEFPDSMKEGMYTVYLSMANYHDNQVSVAVNDSFAYHYVNIPATYGPNGEFDGSMVYYKEREIGDVYIKEGKNTITVKACKNAFTLKDITLVYKNTEEIHSISHSALYSCVNNGLSGNEGSTSPEIGYITGEGANLLPNKMLVMRNKSKFTFDISDLSGGTYRLSSKYATNTNENVNLIFSDKTESASLKATTNVFFPSTGSWNNYSENVILDEVFIPKNINFVTLDIVSGANQLDYLVFEKISDEAQRFEKRYDEVTNMTAGDGFYAGKVDGVDRVTFENPINGATSNTTSAGMRQGYFMEYDFSCLPDGKYTVSLVGATYLDNSLVDIYVNDVLKIQNAVISKTGAYSELLNYKEIAVPGVLELKAENKIIKVKAPVNRAFNIKAVVLKEISPEKPSVSVYDKNETQTDSVTDGTMSARVSLGDFYDGKDTMFVFVIYKEDIMGRKQIYKTAYKESNDKSEMSSVIDGIAKEEGFSYSYKVFLLKSENYSGYVFE